MTLPRANEAVTGPIRETADAVPDTYCGVAVPVEIAAVWRRWEAANWRTFAHGATNEPYPPDQRATVSPPEGMCPYHRQSWREYRDTWFDYRTGDRWPGGGGSFLDPTDPRGAGHVLEQRRVEWDEKASEQMQLVERICLSGRSPQCDRPAAAPSPELREAVLQGHLWCANATCPDCREVA